MLTLKYISLAILAALILSGSPSAWMIVALIIALSFNIVPDFINLKRRKDNR